MERTLVMMYPDGVQRGLVGEIIGRFEKKGFHLKGLKLLQNGDQSLAEKLYADLSSKMFPNQTVDQYHLSGALVCMVWEGKNVVTIGRKMIGATNSEPGTICGDFSIDKGRNVIHGSDSLENAKKEVDLWFPDGSHGRIKDISDLLVGGVHHHPH